MYYIHKKLKNHRMRLLEPEFNFLRESHDSGYVPPCLKKQNAIKHKIECDSRFLQGKLRIH